MQNVRNLQRIASLFMRFSLGFLQPSKDQLKSQSLLNLKAFSKCSTPCSVKSNLALTKTDDKRQEEAGIDREQQELACHLDLDLDLIKYVQQTER
ncbi:hypothetical protein ACLKA6_019158 [Drosophila palustris]